MPRREFFENKGLSSHGWAALHWSGPLRGCSGRAGPLDRSGVEHPARWAPCGAVATRTSAGQFPCSKVAFSRRPNYGTRFDDVRRRRIFVQHPRTRVSVNWGHAARRVTLSVPEKHFLNEAWSAIPFLPIMCTLAQEYSGTPPP